MKKTKLNQAWESARDAILNYDISGQITKESIEAFLKEKGNKK
jgi:peptide subunit release factor 1 (eRF1)